MDYCVCCGEYVPEGTMVCSYCRDKYFGNENEHDKVSAGEGYQCDKNKLETDK